MHVTPPCRHTVPSVAALTHSAACIDVTASWSHVGTRRGTESIRCHPFFWGLNWEALEARELTPPYAAHCLASHKAVITKFDESARAGALKVMPPSMRPCSREEGESNAAAAAMDKMFDFSAW